jgi:predicted Zn-dependent protease
MKPLEWPNEHHLQAAIGWLELGNWREANEELECIAPEQRGYTDVLQVRCQIYAAAEKWDYLVEVAGALGHIRPDSSFAPLHHAYALRKLGFIATARDVLVPIAEKFTKEWRVSYQLACYCCQLGDKQRALWWLENAIDTAGSIDIRMKALDEPDLESLWLDIAEI